MGFKEEKLTNLGKKKKKVLFLFFWGGELIKLLGGLKPVVSHQASLELCCRPRLENIYIAKLLVLHRAN